MMEDERPMIPREEFKLRRDALRARMVEADIDLFVAYSDDRATFGQQHSRYLFNYQPHFEPALTVVPRAGEAFIATGPESDGYVQASSHCSKVRVVDAFAHPDEEYPFSEVARLAEVLGALKSGKAAKIAIAGLDALPHRSWKALRQASAADLIDGDGLILPLRAVKSPSEIAVIRHAYRIAEAGVGAAIGAIAVGVSEREVAAEAEHVMRRLGSEGMGIDTIVGAGRDNTRVILTRTTHRRIRTGDHVLLTIAPRYEGYHGAIGRVVAVGTVDPEVERAVEVAIAAQDAALTMLKPGMTGAEIDAAARGVCDKAGLGRHFAYSGIHSVGVCEFEPPILTSWSDEPLAADMVFSIDIPIFFATWGGLRIEDGFLLGESGTEPLQTISRTMSQAIA